MEIDKTKKNILLLLFLGIFLSSYADESERCVFLKHDEYVNFFEFSGISPSVFLAKNTAEPIIENIDIYELCWDKEILRNRICTRTAQMLENGLIAEAKELFADILGTKPENIIVNHFGYAILLDFGLCQSTEMAAHPNTDEFVTGSPYYLPPERLLGKAENRASEIYSLGMVMFFSITGRTFYESNELESLVQRHVSGLRINSSVKMEGIRKPVADIISKMVMMEPSERYQTYESAANDILAVLQ